MLLTTGAALAGIGAGLAIGALGAPVVVTVGTEIVIGIAANAGATWVKDNILKE